MLTRHHISQQLLEKANHDTKIIFSSIFWDVQENFINGRLQIFD